MPTLVKVKKWGSRMVVIIPSRFAKTRKIEVGSVVDLDEMQVVEPGRRRLKLADLMDQFKPQHCQGEWNLGAPASREIW